MSRTRDRARKRRARLEKVRAEFQEKRQDPGALEELLRRHAESEFRLWDIARPADDAQPLDDAEQAMIGQIVAPRLAGMTPGLIHRCHDLSGMDAETAWNQANRKSQSRRSQT